MASEIIGYKPYDTILHRLDPRVKLLWFLAFSLPAVSWNDPLWLTGLLITVIGLGLIAKSSFRGMVKVMVILIPAMITLLFFNVFWFEGTVTASLPKWPLFYLGWAIPKIGGYGPYGHVSLEALIFAWGAMLRIIIVVLSGRLLLSFTSPSEVTSAMSKLLAPMEMSTAVSVAFGFLPVTASQVTSVFEAQKSRGWKISTRNPVKALKAFVPTVLPIISRSISRSEFLAAAIASRGYAYNPRKRTTLREVKFRRADWAALGVFIALLAASQLIAFVLGWADYRFTVRLIRGLLGIPT